MTAAMVFSTSSTERSADDLDDWLKPCALGNVQAGASRTTLMVTITDAESGSDLTSPV